MYPVDKAVIVHNGKITIKGWAYSGGGHWPVRVEASGDGGSIWYEVPYDKMSPKYYYAWKLWEIDLPVNAEGWLELVVRCWDNAQPTFVRSTWSVASFYFSHCRLLKHFCSAESVVSTENASEQFSH